MKHFVLELNKDRERYGMEMGGISATVEEGFEPIYLQEYSEKKMGEPVLSKIYELKLIKDFRGKRKEKTKPKLSRRENRIALIKLLLAATFPLWAFPVLFWGIADMTYEEYREKKRQRKIIENYD